MIELHALHKTYETGTVRVEALRGIDLAVGEGEFLEIKGPSGSGKSTLLNMIGLPDEPTSGQVALNGHPTEGLGDAARSRLRNRTIGFVFQRFNLIAQMNVWKNVALPCRYAGIGRAERRKRALDALARVGLNDRAHHLPAQLSGGEEQRAAIARSLVMEPRLILADEPTGNLDTESGREVMGWFAQAHDGGTTVIVVTHDPIVDPYVKRCICLRDGRLQADGR